MIYTLQTWTKLQNEEILWMEFAYKQSKGFNVISYSKYINWLCVSSAHVLNKKLVLRFTRIFTLKKRTLYKKNVFFLLNHSLLVRFLIFPSLLTFSVSISSCHCIKCIKIQKTTRFTHLNSGRGGKEKEKFVPTNNLTGKNNMHILTNLATILALLNPSENY